MNIYIHIYIYIYIYIYTYTYTLAVNLHKIEVLLSVTFEKGVKYVERLQ